MSPAVLILIAASTCLAAVILIRTLTLTQKHRNPSAPLEAPNGTAPDIDVRAAAERLAGAVRIRTETRHTRDSAGKDDPFQTFHAYLETAYPRVHDTLHRSVIAGHSLLYTWEGKAPEAKPILLMGHMDVVPADPETRDIWTHPPFSGLITDTHIWGRGTLDDKQAVLGLLEAVEGLLKAGYEPRRTIILAFGHDEEASGIEGAGNIAAHLREQGVRGAQLPFAYALDEGMAVTEGLLPGVEVPIALVGTAEKGSFNVRLVAAGEGGHTSMPPDHTAVGRLSTAIHKLEHQPRPLRMTPPVRQMFDAITPEMRFSMRMAFANRWLFGGLINRTLAAAPQTNAVVRSTAAASVLRAGVRANVLPSRAEAIVNYRILPGETTVQMLQHTREVVAGLDVEVEPAGGFHSEPSPVAEIASPSFKILSRTICQFFPDATVAPALVTGATDSRHYQELCDAVYRFSPIRVTPDDLGRIHGVDERIGIEAYARVIRFYAQLILNSDRPESNQTQP